MQEIARPILFVAGALADSELLIEGPAAVLLSAEHEPRVLASGHLADVLRHPVCSIAQRISAPDSILIPGLANAHTHLDLTHIGPIAFDPQSGFRSFIDAVRSGRRSEPSEIEHSVRRGASLLKKGGTVAVGDIAGAVGGLPHMAAAHALASTGLTGFSYLEFFAMSPAGPALVRDIEPLLDLAASAQSPIKRGLQPHAPYSVSPSSYAAALELAAKLHVPVCTHLAETPEEVEFIASGSGPLRELLESLGVWHDDLKAQFGHSRTPVAHVVGRFANPKTVVHVNHCTDDDLESLRASGVTVIYCPRSSAYFGWERFFGPHRYRDMIRAGVNVALGTDSIINLPHPDRISVLDEMRFLHARDAVSPRTLLAMSTVNAATTLGIDADRFLFRVGAKPLGVLAIRIDSHADPLGQVMQSTHDPHTLWSRW